MNIPEIKNDEEMVKIMGELERNLVKIIPPDLPIPVQRFCGEINKNFAATAEALESTAAKLEAAAAELRSRASDLRDASPDVRAQVERWISFERESNERGKFLQTLFDK